MRICILCVNKDDYAPTRIYQESKKRGHEAYLMRWSDVIMEVSDSRIFIGDRKKSIDGFDVIIPRSPNFTIGKGNNKMWGRFGTVLRLIIEYAKKNDIKFLNDIFFQSYQSEDKLAQQFFLASNNLPGIPTWHFSSINEVPAIKKIEFPVVVKKSRGSLGIGVYKINNRKELEKILNTNRKTEIPMITQKYFPITCDYRILVIGGKAVGVIKRVSSKNEWRTNVSLGGKAVALSNSKNREKIITLAEKIAKKMKFDYVGVDILESEKKLHVIEVNSLAQFKGFEKAFPKINIAEKIIRLMEKRIKKNHN
jgi:RimK family alpha-L-glutamate ligase